MTMKFLRTTRLYSLTLIHLLLCLFWCNTGIVSAQQQAKTTDLYQILGVARTATAKEIKQAYRRKALNTHPDKNTNLPPEEAAENFRQVVHAFEILSDSASRQYYDRTGQTSKGNNNNNNQFNQGGGFSNQGGTWTFTFNWNVHRRVYRLKDRFDVQEAQSRVLHVVSMEQLQTVMLDDDDRLERNLLLSFVVPGTIETIVNDDMVFPFPFAGMSSQNIWWEDLLQTVQIRFHKSNELTEFFDIPSGEDYRASGQPIFLFGKRGQKLNKFFSRIQTRDRSKFELWMWEQIEVQVEFVNAHTHPVEIYWLHGNQAHFKAKVDVGEPWLCNTMLSHEFYVRDARVDTRADSPGRHKLSSSSSLGTWKILSDTSPQQIVIAPKTCFDLSGHCPFWDMQHECTKNPGFMHDICRKTCKICNPEDDDIPEEDDDDNSDNSTSSNSNDEL
jgi:curved DNA-binding protein CbpA